MIRKILNIISTVLLVILIGLVVFIFVVRMTGNSPSLFGYQVFRVSSDSMVPTLAVGDIIVVKEVPVEEIQRGDIITYTATSGSLEGNTITHRVVDAPHEVDGEYRLQTMGDKEGATADPEITFDQVKGKYLRTLPYIDRLYSFFLSPAGLIVFVFIIVALFGYEMISLVLSYRHIDEMPEEYYAPKSKKKSKKCRKK